MNRAKVLTGSRKKGRQTKRIYQTQNEEVNEKGM